MVRSERAESPDDAGELLLLRVERRFFEEMGGPEYAVHGRADLVAHVGEEPSLRTPRGKGLVARLAQHVLGSAALRRVASSAEVEACDGQDRGACHEHDEPSGGSPFVPAGDGPSRQPPGSDGEIHPHALALAREERSVAEEHLALRAEAVSPPQGQGEVGMFPEVGALEQAVDVDDRRDETPYLLRPVTPAAVDGEAGDETASALHEVDRSGEHGPPGLDRVQRGVTLRGVRAVVEAQQSLVSLLRVDVPHDEVGRRGEVRQPVVAAKEV